MSVPEYSREATALLFVDPYNDFLSEGGLVWPRLKEVAEEIGLLDNLRAVQQAVRAAGIRIFIVPHRQWEPGDYESWEHVNPTQRGIMHRHSFAKGTWGGEFHRDFAPRSGDLVVHQHWGQSGFANTDLDLQLRQHGITHVRSWDSCQHLHRIYLALCNGVGLPRDPSARCDCGVYA